MYICGASKSPSRKHTFINLKHHSHPNHQETSLSHSKPATTTMHSLTSLATLIALPLLALTAPTPQGITNDQITTQQYRLKTAYATECPDRFNDLYLAPGDIIPHSNIAIVAILTPDKGNAAIGFQNTTLQGTSTPITHSLSSHHSSLIVFEPPLNNADHLSASSTRPGHGRFIPAIQPHWRLQSVGSLGDR